jgi:hypothetical protein
MSSVTWRVRRNRQGKPASCATPCAHARLHARPSPRPPARSPSPARSPALSPTRPTVGRVASRRVLCPRYGPRCRSPRLSVLPLARVLVLSWPCVMCRVSCCCVLSSRVACRCVRRRVSVRGTVSWVVSGRVLTCSPTLARSRLTLALALALSRRPPHQGTPGRVSCVIRLARPRHALSRRPLHQGTPLVFLSMLTRSLCRVGVVSWRAASCVATS